MCAAIFLLLACGESSTLDDVHRINCDLIEINGYGYDDQVSVQVIIWDWRWNQDTLRLERKARTWYVSEHLLQVPIEHLGGRWVMRFHVHGRPVLIGGKAFCRSRTVVDAEVRNRTVWSEVPAGIYSSGGPVFR